jgi:3-oxoadipate enol-lactonase
MADFISRRGMLHQSVRTVTALGISSMASELTPVFAAAQNAPADRTDARPAPTIPIALGLDLYYREDWLGKPWLNPEPVLFIHGVGESGAAWFGWVPRMAQEFRLFRPDLPGFGHSTVSDDFAWSLPNLAMVFAHFLDALHLESAHIIGAKLGGAIASQFAADYPRRTRTLVLAGAALTPPVYRSTSASILEKEWVTDTQADRLGSGASKEEVEYWNKMMATASQRTKDGVGKVASMINMDNIMPRIAAPTLVITTDRNALRPVETILHYQQKIPNSRLLVLPSDAYHVAVAKPDECVTNVLSFIKETQTRG